MTLLGKDYLDPVEAAEYACVPLPEFEAQAEQHGIASFTWMGRVVYRKADIQAAMERAWRQSTPGGVRNTSSGQRRASRGGSASVPLPTPRPRHHA